MASVRYDEARRRWIANWRDAERKQRKQQFETEAEAVACANEHGGVKAVKAGGRGRRPRTRAEVIDAIAGSFEVADNGCWEWTGTLHKEGYGQINWKPAGKLIAFAHRVVLAAIGEPLPDGLVVDHLCRNRRCCNPDHLELVTQRENVMRSPIAPGAINARKTHCPQGHPYSSENTSAYYGLGGRSTWSRACKTCAAASQARSYARKRSVPEVSR